MGLISAILKTKAILLGFAFGIVSTKAFFVNFHLIGSLLPSILIDSISEGYNPAHVWPFGTKLVINPPNFHFIRGRWNC